MTFSEVKFAELMKMLTSPGKITCVFCGLVFWFQRGLELRVFGCGVFLWVFFLFFFARIFFPEFFGFGMIFFFFASLLLSSYFSNQAMYIV